VTLTLLRLAPFVLLAGLAVSCRSAHAPEGIDRSLSSCIPADAVVLAGIDLDRLRSSPLLLKLPWNLQAFPQLQDSSMVLLAWNGKDLLFIERGHFHQPLAGATLVAPDLALAGSEAAVRDATAQHRSGRPGAPQLLARIPPAYEGRQAWLVASGGATLPLTGNAENATRLLHETDFVTLASTIDSAITLDLTADCRTPDAARQFEENLRALVSLAAATNKRQPDLTTLLKSIRIARDTTRVRATLSAAPDAIGLLFGHLPR
jgi:hypothetical protein